MKRIKVYLAGCRGEWREKVKEKIPEIEALEPFKKEKIASKDYVTLDLEMVKEADVIFAVVNYPVYTGLCVEVGYAYALGKEVILVFLLKDYIDPLLMVLCRKVFTDLDKGIEWFKKDLERKERESNARA